MQIEVKAPRVTRAGVIAGAFVTAALSLVMLALGTGIGISSMRLGSERPLRLAC
ncbi:MAG TPA: hypothetical protein VNU84_04025 [Candidatus Acidoferrum sp.]|nr:hypothetical protein [Candidatus Acidoferrum sp.]